jgi:integrase
MKKDYRATFAYLKDQFTRREIDQVRKTIPYFKAFLSRYSQSGTIRIKIIDLALYCKKEFNKKILEITLPEMIQFFEDYVSKLPGRDHTYISKSTAKLWRTFIRKYFDIVNVYRQAEKKELIPNPVPPKEVWDFDKIERTLDFLSEDEEKAYLTYHEIETILNQLYINYIQATERRRFKELQVWVVVSLQVYSGARIREACQIKLHEIDTEKRYFKTIVKSPKTHKRKGVYFFPGFFIPEIKYYLKNLKEVYPDLDLSNRNTRLFHYPSNKKGYISKRIIQYRIQKIKETHDLHFKKLTHPFRDYLNTQRESMGLLSDKKRKALLNQTSRSVNLQSYMKRWEDLIELRKIYDKYNPYKKLIKPSPSLSFL